MWVVGELHFNEAISHQGITILFCIIWEDIYSVDDSKKSPYYFGKKTIFKTATL